MCFTTRTYASNKSTSDENFDIIDLEYVVAEDENAKKISGTTWEYGNIDMWSAIYKKKRSRSMFYFVLVKTKVSSNINSLKNGYYRMVNDYMELKVDGIMDSSSQKLKLRKYAPLGDFFGENTSTESNSVSLGIGLKNSTSTNVSSSNIEVTENNEQSLSFGVQWTTNYSIGNVNYIASSDDSSLTSKLTFVKKSDKKLNNAYPYRGDFFLNTIVVYELEDYTEELEKALHFQIQFKGAIQKFSCHIFGCTGYESLSENYQKKYDIDN
ncbi:MAG: hypothetical protein NC325_04260 [Anaeroplasma bactoclasticum]|nr:hypothetical protein [Anaeroplasma bactoclasticum]